MSAERLEQIKQKFKRQKRPSAEAKSAAATAAGSVSQFVAGGAKSVQQVQRSKSKAKKA